jgi:hypothetical protein
MQQTRLNESADALAARENLRLAEIELMRQREKVAEMRRQLPQGPVVEDYVFQEGPTDLDAGDAPVRTSGSASSSPARIGHSSSTSSCTARRRRARARCARYGSMATTAWPTTWRRTSTS